MTLTQRESARPRTLGRVFRSAGLLAILTLVPGLETLTAHAADGTEAADAVGAGSRTADAPLMFDTNLGLIERATMQAVEEALEGLRLDPGSDIRLHAMTTSEGSWFVEDCIARVLSQKGYSVHLASVARSGAGTISGSVAPTGGAAPSLADALNRTNAPPTDGAAGAVDSLAVTSPSPSTPGEEDVAADPADPTRYARRQQEMLAQAQAAGQGTAPSEPIEGSMNPLPEGEGLVLSYRIVEFGVTYHDSWRSGFMGPRQVERLASVNLYTRLVNGTAEDVLWVGRGRCERLDVVPKSKLDLLEGRTYPFQKPELQGRPLSRLAEPILVSGIIAGLVFLFYSSQN